MRWKGFRRSDKVEDYTNPDKAVTPETPEGLTLNDQIKLTGSDLAKEAGADDVGKKPKDAAS